MDELYDNLDNYNEETTIAELQAENKELKSKLEVYSESMAKLQKDILQDFDKLASGYKQLEVNYSSLLKTAKAEIERKTQIITNLNLEKDRMVLKSYQNKNTNNPNKLSHHDSTGPENYKKSKNEDEQQLGGKKSSPHSATDRTVEDDPPSRDTKASLQPDLRFKLLNLAHERQQHDSNTKENNVQIKKDSDVLKPRASIRDRRKSMPAICMDMDQQFSDDDVELTSNTYSKNLQQTKTEHNFCERPRSRMSGTSSLEEKKSGYHEPIPDNTTKQRTSRYDRYRNDKYRVRHKSSHRYKRSPERHHSGSREYFDPYCRLEYDRYRGKGRISGSPLRDKLYQKPSREFRRSNYENNYPYEHERMLPRSQERYPIKRRLDQGYDEIEHKKLRVESHSRQHEDVRIELDNKRPKMESFSRHHEEDRRIKVEKPPTHKYISDPLEIQFSSCESPDYDYANVSNSHVKEIKLTATTKLDDPRTSSKKYVVINNDGKVNITTSVGRNVDLVPIRKIAWGITPVSMPEALVKRPPDIEQPAKDMCNKIDNPANTSGEIPNDINIQSPHQTINEVPGSERKELPVLMTKCEEPIDLEKSIKNILRYKIPKTRKTVDVDDKQNSEHSKETILPAKTHDNPSIESDVSKNSELSIKIFDINKHQVDITEEKREPHGQKQDDFVIHNKSQLSSSDTSDIHKYSTNKGVVISSLKSDVSKNSDMLIKNIDEPLDTENSIKNILRYKIPKTRKSVDDKLNSEHSEETNLPVKKHENVKLMSDVSMNSEILIKNVEVNKHQVDIMEEKKEPHGQKQDDFVKHSNSQFSSSDASDKHKYSTAKGVVENDLQMSDDNCDDNEQSDQATKIAFLNTTIDNKTLNKDKSFNIITENQSAHAIDKATSEPFKDKTSKKSKTKKKSKHREKKRSEDSAKLFENPTKTIDKKKETKVKHIKTKFSELFDDSTSLISPEDLGLSSAPAPLVSDSVPFFEDALDADDSMKSDTRKEFTHLENINVQNKPFNDVTVTEIDPIDLVNQENSFGKSDSCNGLRTELTDDVIETIYQNLEPGVPEENVVKTVIISTGTQPPDLTQIEKQLPPRKPESQQKSIQDLSLEALATSTPQKIWQSDNVVTDLESKLPDSGCNSNSNSEIVSIENTVSIEKSDSTTVDSQINDCNVPDIRIFVKRRRKFTKK